MAHRYHKGAAWFRIKEHLVEDFRIWCKDVDTEEPEVDDMIEFLFQKGFIQGKAWLEYIDNLPEIPVHRFLENRSVQPLREGYIIPTSIIGHRGGKTNVRL